MENMDWFKVFDSSKAPLKMEQGLILTDFSYINPAKISNYTIIEQRKNMTLPVLNQDVIILTQSCELIKNDLRHVQLCPIFTFEEFWSKNSKLVSDTFTKEILFVELSKARRPSKYLINKCNLEDFSKFAGKHLVACFDLSFIASPQYIKNYLTLKSDDPLFPQLNPPYREALAQSYGFYYMRIGNPINYSPLITSSD